MGCLQNHPEGFPDSSHQPSRPKAARGKGDRTPIRPVCPHLRSPRVPGAGAPRAAASLPHTCPAGPRPGLQSPCWPPESPPGGPHSHGWGRADSQVSPRCPRPQFTPPTVPLHSSPHTPVHTTHCAPGGPRTSSQFLSHSWRRPTQQSAGAQRSRDGTPFSCHRP